MHDELILRVTLYGENKQPKIGKIKKIMKKIKQLIIMIKKMEVSIKKIGINETIRLKRAQLSSKARRGS